MIHPIYTRTTLVHFSVVKRQFIYIAMGNQLYALNVGTCTGTVVLTVSKTIKHFIINRAGNSCIVATDDKKMHSYKISKDLYDFDPLNTIELEDDVTDIRFHPSKGFFVCFTNDGTAYIFNLKFDCLFEHTFHAQPYSPEWLTEDIEEQMVFLVDGVFHSVYPSRGYKMVENPYGFENRYSAITVWTKKFMLLFGSSFVETMVNRSLSDSTSRQKFKFDFSRLKGICYSSTRRTFAAFFSNIPAPQIYKLAFGPMNVEKIGYLEIDKGYDSVVVNTSFTCMYWLYKKKNEVLELVIDSGDIYSMSLTDALLAGVTDRKPSIVRERSSSKKKEPELEVEVKDDKKPKKSSKSKSKNQNKTSNSKSKANSKSSKPPLTHSKRKRSLLSKEEMEKALDKIPSVKSRTRLKNFLNGTPIKLQTDIVPKRRLMTPSRKIELPSINDFLNSIKKEPEIDEKNNINSSKLDCSSQRQIVERKGKDEIVNELVTPLVKKNQKARPVSPTGLLASLTISTKDVFEEEDELIEKESMTANEPDESKNKSNEHDDVENGHETETITVTETSSSIDVEMKKSSDEKVEKSTSKDKNTKDVLIVEETKNDEAETKGDGEIIEKKIVRDDDLEKKEKELVASNIEENESEAEVEEIEIEKLPVISVEKVEKIQDHNRELANELKKNVIIEEVKKAERAGKKLKEIIEPSNKTNEITEKIVSGTSIENPRIEENKDRTKNIFNQTVAKKSINEAKTMINVNKAASITQSSTTASTGTTTTATTAIKNRSSKQAQQIVKEKRERMMAEKRKKSEEDRKRKEEAMRKAKEKRESMNKQKSAGGKMSMKTNILANQNHKNTTQIISQAKNVNVANNTLITNKTEKKEIISTQNEDFAKKKIDEDIISQKNAGLMEKTFGQSSRKKSLELKNINLNNSSKQ
eukprot:TRINITY_DN3246_c0_g11_i1.p1 TRINITY_DN3246_c0_g11~~TRINITY_DN3246_c0_g11_i1.p1  ORF type:complete len:922 (-),score=275.60 TRINITY_DN3246_c0_g11_i1:1058-3823(-)